MSYKLIEAADQEDFGKVRSLLKLGINVNYVDEDGVTALITATYAGNTRLVKLLLENGADVNYNHPETDSALFIAFWLEDFEMIRLLLEYGADPELIDKFNKTIFDYALEWNNEELIDLLRNRDVA